MHCAKKITFLTQNIAEKYSVQKLPRKFAKKFTKKINGKHINLIPLLLGWQQSQQNVVAFFLQKNFRGVVYDNDIKQDSKF